MLERQSSGDEGSVINHCPRKEWHRGAIEHKKLYIISFPHLLLLAEGSQAQWPDPAC